MRILVDDEIDAVMTILAVLTEEIKQLKDRTSHKTTCGCKKCDSMANQLGGAWQILGKEQ